jgi:hypothetical protein
MRLNALLWPIFVPGTRYVTCFWTICLAMDVVLETSMVSACVDAGFALLNAYSYDYQQRKGTLS